MQHRILFYLTLIAVRATSLGGEPVPLIHAHAHNDYVHKRPLFNALDDGFCSVEADIYLVDGQLLVAHVRSQVKPERTLQALYLDPLSERVKKNGGHVYPAGPEFTLLVEIKADWRTTDYRSYTRIYLPQGSEVVSARMKLLAMTSKPSRKKVSPSLLLLISSSTIILQVTFEEREMVIQANRCSLLANAD